MKKTCCALALAALILTAPKAEAQQISDHVEVMKVTSTLIDFGPDEAKAINQEVIKMQQEFINELLKENAELKAKLDANAKTQ